MRLLQRSHTIRFCFDRERCGHDANRDVGSYAAYFPREIDVAEVFFTIKQNQFNEGIRLIENRSDAPLQRLDRTLKRHENRDNAVRA